MKLSVKGPDGKIEVFERVDNWSLSILHREVMQRFNLKWYGNDRFFLYFIWCAGSGQYLRLILDLLTQLIPIFNILNGLLEIRYASYQDYSHTIGGDSGISDPC